MKILYYGRLSNSDDSGRVSIELGENDSVAAALDKAAELRKGLTPAGLQIPWTPPTAGGGTTGAPLPGVVTFGNIAPAEAPQPPIIPNAVETSTQDAIDALTRFWKSSPAQALELVKQFGVQHVNQLDAEQRTAFVTAVKEKLQS